MKDVNFELSVNTSEFKKAIAKFRSMAVPYAANYVKQINEIAAIVKVSLEEVQEFYDNHTFTLDFIKQAVLAGAKLDADDIAMIMVSKTMGIMSSVTDLQDLDKKTWHDYLTDIPFYLACWISYPFIWLAYWLWQGILRAKYEVWD